MSWPRFEAPSGAERLLVAAAVAPAPRAAEAWDEWFDGVVLEEVPYHEARLLPQVFANLLAQGEAGRLPPRLRGKYRWVWASNQLRIDAVAPGLETMIDAGIPVLAMKGAAMLAADVVSWGAREMGDVDVAVPIDRLGDAARALEVAGWQGRYGVDATTLVLRIRDRRYSWNFDRGDHDQIDVHWHVLAARPDPGVARDYWRHARRLPLGRVTVAVPDAVGIVVNTMEHASRAEPMGRLLWVVDAARALAHVDEDELVERARALEVGEVVESACAVLADAVGVVEGRDPARVADRLRAQGPTRRGAALGWARAPKVGARELPRTGELVNALLLRTGRPRDLGQAAVVVARRRIEPRLWRRPWVGIGAAVLRPPRRARVLALRWFGPPARPPALDRIPAGEWLELGDGENLDRVGGRGWSFPYGIAVWAEGREARLVLDPAIPEGRALRLDLRLEEAIVHAQSRWVRVFVNERPVVLWDAQHSYDTRELSVEIPAWLADWCRPIEVTFRTVEPFQPAARDGQPDDVRPFLCVTALRVGEA